MGYEGSMTVGPPSERAHMDRRTPDEIRALLLEVARATASHRDLASLLRELADLLCRIAGAEQLTLVLHDPERDRMRLHIVAAREPVEGVGLDLAIADSPSGSVWQTQQPLVIPSIERETRFTEVMQRLLADGMRSLCVLPLTSPLRRIGGLGFSSREENAFQPADVEFLQQLTSQVALAVDNTLHHESAEHAQRELARERDRLSLLLEINNALVSNLEPRALFSAICQFLRRVVAHEYTSLGIYDAKQNAFDLWAIEFAGKGLLREHMIVPMEGSPAGRAFAAGKAVLFERTDLEAMSSEAAALLLAEGVQRMCTVPLTAHDRRLGALGVGRVGGEPFTPDDVEILTAVAKQVAFSIENALAFQEIETLREKLEAEKVYLQDEIRTQHNFEEIIGESPALNRILHEVEKVAPTDSAVLITGETGTGKELIARAVHDAERAPRAPVRRRQLRRHPERTARERALRPRARRLHRRHRASAIGRFELADGGTLFLDEIGELSARAAGEAPARPPGARVRARRRRRARSRVDVRVVAATNRDLEAMVAAGTFRRISTTG